MHKATTIAAIGLMTGLMTAGATNAATINVGGDITTSTTWTSNNTYNLTAQVYVKNGATLTIQPGTIIASVPTVNGAGSLAITRGSKIIAKGNCDNPIIFTSTADKATWTGGDPQTGTWREAANEWGNVTIMGRAFVSNTIDVAGNTANCNANNISPMEGLTADFPGDPDVFFGGGDDEDDSGCLQYVSIRYGGRVVGLGDELNGLSLGGIGRETDIDHVEIMNNVDDGIEIWGGTVNLKYISIWNVGDDSFDIDQGWRGKAQFVLVVQGYSVNASQGSGVGDNCLELDGAEKADAQPVGTVAFYNFTVIGQPAPGAGDHGVEYRDGMRAQIRNSVFMDLGDKLMRNGVSDGEGSLGYGFNGSASFVSTWSTPYTTHSGVNACSNPGVVYQAQSAGNGAIGQGFLNEITDSVFFRNLNSAYSSAAPNEGADQMSVTIAGGSNAAKGNVVIAGFADADAPIVQLVRETADVDSDGLPGRTAGGTIQLRVLSLDPRAKNAATSSVSMAPNDGFFTPVNYRGAFSPTENWLCGWTASDAFGFIKTPGNVCVPCIPPPACPADLANNDNAVDIFDLLVLLGNWGTSGPGADLAPANNVVDIFDLLALLGVWGDC